MNRYFIIYKPYQVLCQFTTGESKKTLKDFFDVPHDVYPVGRLDYDSEGLLVLTNDTSLNHPLLTPSYKHEREYWVQVEGIITREAITKLQSGVSISIDGKAYKTLPCKAVALSHQPVVAPRNPPIRFRQNKPVSWITLILTEGKNRQVRRMTAKVGYPTLRLIRYRIQGLNIIDLLPGQMVELSKENIYAKLFGKS